MGQLKREKLWRAQQGFAPLERNLHPRRKDERDPPEINKEHA